MINQALANLVRVPAGASLEEVADPDADVFEQVSSILEAQSLRRHIAKLPSPEREVVLWRSGIGGAPVLNQREIAERLGCSQPWVIELEQRAMRLLGQAYELEAA